jgi:hypothetical protein
MLIGSVVTACASGISKGQDRIWKVFNDKATLGFGTSIDSVGDLDGDGFPDLIVGVPDDSNAGKIVLYSGSSGAMLTEIRGAYNEAFGAAVSRTGDVDGDGVLDFAVSTFDPGAMINDTGRVTVYSGATSNLIWMVDGQLGEFLGAGIADMGDVDGDGIDDLIAGARFGGYARAMSGIDGSTIYSVTSPSLNPGGFGWNVAAGGDVDGDGIGDFMVSDPYNCDPGPCTGAAYVFSGKSGQLLYTEFALYDNAYMGLGMAILGDINGDGFSDFGAGAPRETTLLSTEGGYALICSGKDGAVLYKYDENRAGHRNWHTGGAFAPAGDLNADGYDDFLIGSWGAGDFYRPGNVYLYSGRDGGELYHYEDVDSDHGPNGFGFVLASLGSSGPGPSPAFAVSAPGERTLPGMVRTGSVSTWTARELFVDAQPRYVVPSQAVTLTLAQAEPAQLYGFFLVDVNGTPAFNLLSVGTLDATGRAYLSGTAGAGVLNGITIQIEGIVINSAGRLIASNREEIYFQ